MKQRVLVSGGAGFIGSRTVMRLLERGDDVTVYDDLSPQIHGAAPETTSFTYPLIRGKCEIIRDSVCNGEALKRAIKDKDVVFHFAAETGTGQSMYEISNYVQTNVGGTAVLAEAILSSGGEVNRLILSSSRSVYGEGAYLCPTHGMVFPGTRAVDDMSRGDFEVKCPSCGVAVEAIATPETARLNPISVYASTKLSQEHLLKTALARTQLSLVILRYQNVFGPGQSLRNPYTGIISIFSVAILGERKVMIFEDGMESRDFIYIDDVAEANLRACSEELPNYTEINVGSGTPTSVLDVYKNLAELLEQPEAYEITGEFRIGDIRHNFSETLKLQKHLRFAPRWKFKEGLARVAEWARNQHESDSNDGPSYEQSLEELRRLSLLKGRS